MRHAYLIIAHSNWKQLQLLLRLLDSDRNDIYIHIDKKAKDVPVNELKISTKKSSVEIFRTYEVYWGSYELVQSELLLFEQAHKLHYDYYHLLSGADLPIKPQKDILRFFEEHNGYEFIHYDTEERLQKDHEIRRRTQLYHFLQNYRRRFSFAGLNLMFTFVERMLLALQLVFRVDRMKKHTEFPIKYGSQWVSITDDLVEYLLSQKELIGDVFKYTNCADELFIQSIVYNSEFRHRLYDQNFDDDTRGNMRLIDMKHRGKNGNPYTWKITDWDEIQNSQCLFARKFNIQEDPKIIEKVFSYISN